MPVFDHARRLIARFAPSGYLWDGAPAAEPVSPAPASPASPTPAPATPAAPATPSAAAPAVVDRSTWIPPDKFRAAEAAINRTARELEQARNDIKERDRRIQEALSGGRTKSKEEADADQIAEAFYALPQFAHLRGLTADKLAIIDRLVEQGESVQAAATQVWDQHTDKFLSSLESRIAEEYGVEKLTPGQSKKVRAAFGAFMPSATDAEAMDAFRKRYERADPTLIDEFAKDYIDDLVQPIRRSATVPLGERPRVPRGGGSTPVTSQTPKPDLSKLSIQEMLEHGEKEAERVGR
jgi:hypothetical protein